MSLKIAVVIAAILQVVAAWTLNIGAFNDGSRTIEVFIQPASWAFSIWGVIYLLSFIYAGYQLIPRFDNETLRATRMPAIFGFLSSVAWLYFAGMNDWMLWLTAPILFLIAACFVLVILAPEAKDKTQNLLSKKILYPYAAWTGIACWLNVQTLLTDTGTITNETISIVTNAILFVCIAAFTFTFFKKTGYSIWYGGVMVWAGIGVVAANLNGGMITFAFLGGLLAIATLILYVKNVLLETNRSE